MLMLHSSHSFQYYPNAIIMAILIPPKYYESWKTRTNRTPAFWGYPAAPRLPILLTNLYWIPSQNKTNSKLHIQRICQNLCKYELDPASIVEDIERRRFCPQTDRRTDGRADIPRDGQGEICWAGGKKVLLDERSKPQQKHIQMRAQLN